MKRKISVILVIMIMVIGLFVGHTLAASSSDVKLSVFVSPSNPTPGGEVTITISFSELKIGVSAASFAFNYDDTVIESVNAEAGDGWTSSLVGTTYFLNTSDFVDTTKTGTILTLTLKVKNNAQVGTQTNISFSSIQVSAGTDLINNFNELSKTLTISSNEPSKNETSGDNTVENEVTRNEVTEDPTKNEIERNEVDGNDVTEDPTRNEVTDGNGEPVVNTLPVQKINEIGNYTTEDKEVPENKEVPEDKEVPEIPKTGEDYGIQISIIGLIILSIISYVIYRKNKI